MPKSLKDSVLPNTVNENENKLEEASSLKSVSQLTKPVLLPEMNLPIRSTGEFRFSQKSFNSPCKTACSEEDQGTRKDTSPTSQEGEEYFQAFQPNPILLMKQLSCQELDFLSF